MILLVISVAQEGGNQFLKPIAVSQSVKCRRVRPGTLLAKNIFTGWDGNKSAVG